MVGGFDVDGGAETRLVNKDVNIQEGDMGKGDGPATSSTSSPAPSVILSIWARLEIVCPLE